MTTSAGVTTGLELDGVECSPLGGDKLVVRLHGRWPGRPRQAGRRVTLVVEDEGRRHRFPAIPAPRNAPPAADQDAWTASFAVPAWLQPTPETSMSLTIGDANIPVPGPQPSAENGTSAPAAERSDPPVRPAASGNGASRSDSDHPGDGDVRSDSAPISTSDATIAALRAELHQRAGAIARLHGVIADVSSEVEASATAQSRVQTTQDELRRELAELSQALAAERTQRAETESRALSVAAQQASLEQKLTELNAVRTQAAQESKELGRELSTLRKDLATSEVAREAAQSEAAGMRAEVERLGRELVGARENVGDHKAGLAQAEAVLAEARALTASLREQ